MQNVNENATAVITSIMSGISNFVKAMNTVNQGAEESRNKKRGNTNTLNKSSIMNVSKDLVMSFPVICSTSLSSDTVLMIQRAIEINCVTTLQMIFASASLQGNNGIDVIKQWHNNISGDVSMDDYFDYIESLGDGISNLAITSTFESVDYVKKYGPMMIAECKRNEVFYPESSFSESSLLSFELSNGKDGGLNIKTVKEVYTDPATGRVPITVGDPASPSGVKVIFLDPKEFNEIMKNGKMSDSLVKTLEDIYNKNIDRKSEEKKDERDKERFIMDQIKSIQQQLDSKHAYIQKQLLDSDIKKANELVPSMMVIRYTAVGKQIGFTPDSNIKVIDEFIAGVKARLIGCDSVEIIDRIRLALDNKVDLKNFIRATTGEIRFCKDFLLAVDQAKIEAKRNSKLSKTSPIWRALQNRSTKSVFKRISKKTNTAAAITTLVISSEEVNRLNTMYNIDLYNIPKLRQVMEAYNFMEVVIVDEALEVARFLFDNGDKYFQDYSFTALRKEVSESELKKVVNLMSSVNRG